MRLVLLGPPGAGKGTQARTLETEFRVPQIASGDLLRSAVRNRTVLGLEAKAYMDKGALVPDDLVLGLIDERMKQADAKDGFILDGFPRTVAQAEALDAMLAQKGLHLDTVISLDVDQSLLIERIGRRVEEAKANGTPIRKDDDPEVFKKRLDAYNRDTAVVAPFYESRGMLKRIDGMQSVEQVAADIDRALTREQV